MQNTSQVLLRNIDEFQDKSCLILGLSDADMLQEWNSAKVFTDSFASYQALQSRGAEVQFSHLPEQDESVESLVIVLPKSRELLNAWLAKLNADYPSGTAIYLVGEKNAGIQGAAKQFKTVCRQAHKLDMARHCQLWRGELLGEGDFDLSAFTQHFEIADYQAKLNFTSIPGVFNHGKLDEGTKLLLDNLGKIPSHRVLDFGCGAGVIGLHLKARWPDAEVEMLDVSAEAVYASQVSAESNGLDVKVFASNGLSEVQGRYKAIYSNPPFHTGIKTDYGVAQRFIQKAADHLIEGGELRIVANAFLKYPSLIEQYVGPCKVVAETHKFKVYSAYKRR